MRITAAYLAIAFLSLSPLAYADNWGHWRGPTGNGAALNASPPTEWSSSKNVKWKVELPGRENSSPVVWENQVFVSTAVPVDGQKKGGLPTFEFKLLCLNRNDGKLLWRQERHGPFKLNPGITASPVLFQENVLLLCDQGNGNGWLQALDKKSGDIKWEQKRTKVGNCNSTPVLTPSR